MKLLFTLPNGEELDLLGDGPDDMEYVCLVCGEFQTPISELFEDYKLEPNNLRRQAIADKIRDQAYYFAGQIGSFDENLQQMVSWDELGEQIYLSLIQHANECALVASINRQFTKFCTENGYEPHFADCEIKWLDSGDTAEMRIALYAGLREDYDDDIFYFCDGIDDLKSLTEQGVEDFVIVECLEFGEYPELNSK